MAIPLEDEAIDWRRARREALCGPRLARPPDIVDPRMRTAPGTPLVLEADSIFIDSTAARYQLRGKVLMERLDQWLRSDAVDYDAAADRALVPTPFSYSEAGLNLEGTSAEIDLGADTLDVEHARYRLWENYAHGEAGRMNNREGRYTSLDNLRYSTCPPGQEMWWLRASRLDLDTGEGMGRARHTRVEVGGVPLFYFPYLVFPIDDRRRTGLLPPNIGNSSSHGTHVTLPVYLNLAPNYDATIYPTYYSRRGQQIGADFRYLQPSFSGEMTAEYLPNDQILEEDRWAGQLSHRGRLPADIRYDAEINRVSDEDYLRDFSSNLAASSPAELESRASVSQSAGAHSWQAQVRHWQTLRGDPSYRRWPQVDYQHLPGRLPGGVDYRLTSEAVRFAHPDESDRDTGDRVHIEPRFARPWRHPAFFLEPALTARYTRYDLDRPDEDAPESPTRSVPTASLDSGIFLERPFRIGDRLMMQTLEPRLFYLYTPYRDQDDLPVFDTDERSFTVSQLFSENRFSGVDRIGDADQVTVAVTTRFLDVFAGRQFLRGSVGQIHYRRDRRVTLDGEAGDEEERNRSDIFVDADAALPGNVMLRGDYQYDPYEEKWASYSYRAVWQYRPAPDTVLNIDYRVREERVENGDNNRTEQIDTSAVVGLGASWSVFGAWQRSLEERVNLEVAGGVEYRECCWAVRGTMRRYRTGSELEAENIFMLELELTGLASFGQDTRGFLSDMVPGHDDTLF